ncbi:unnamed protein product [Choristocarpus tenellus]
MSSSGKAAAAAAASAGTGGRGQGAVVETRAGPEDGAPPLEGVHSVSQGSSQHVSSELEESLPEPPLSPQRITTTSTPPSAPLRFQPSQEWLEQMKAEVPLNTIMRLLESLAPQVDEMCLRSAAPDESEVVEFVSNTTMVGLLPVPHPIVIRKYHPNHHTAMWFTAFLWGVIYVRSQELPMFDGDKIRLFTVTTS